MRPVLRAISVSLVATSLLFSPIEASWALGRANSLESSGTPFTYKAEGKRLADVLQDFAASQGLPAIVADGVEGTVFANFNTTPMKFLQAISKSYGVLWYHDGSALYFYPPKAIQSKIFRLKGYSRSQLQDLMKSLQLGDQRYPLKFDESQKTLLVYGPPRHVELVSSAIESLDIGANESNERVVRVVPLRFASASDRQLGDHKIPGIASILRSLYVGGAGSASDPIRPDNRVQAGKSKALLAQSAGKLAPELMLKSSDAMDAPSGGMMARSAQSPVGHDDETPAFEADEGTNAVIIHGRGNRMSEYAEVIRRMDVQPDLIELEAMIIDVSSDSVDSLGIDWAFRGARSQFSVTGPNHSDVLSNTGRELVTPGAFNVSTLFANAGRELIARVNALQGQGKARIIAKPKVLGVANRPAIMKEKRQAMVRVAGNLEANLFQVEAGTLLQMTPQIITRRDGNQIKLSLYIEDGNFEAREVDKVPIVKRTEIRTEAHVRDGESLLIGGITLESDTSERNAVPLLGNIPVVGGLFSYKGNRSIRSERMFLITPRILPSVPDTLETSQARGLRPAVATTPSANGEWIR
jgi:type III secretion protein C